MIGTSRRAFLRSLAATVAAGPAVLTACGGPRAGSPPAGSPAASSPAAPGPGRPAAPGEVPLTVLNDTRRFRDDEVWVHVVDPSYRMLHDFAELTNGDTGLWANTTMVDMFGVPLQLTVEGTSAQTTGAVAAGGRAQAFAALAALPAFSGLVVDDLRVIAPGHGLDAGRFAPHHLDAYIATCWARYEAADLVVTTDAGTAVGRAEAPGGSLTLRREGAVVARIARPSTRDVLFCDGALAAPNDGVTGPIAAVLGAALNRSTLLDHPDQPTTDPATFHPDGAVTNDYVRVLHDVTTDGRAYAFAFDDVAERAPLVHDPEPTGLTLTLTPF